MESLANEASQELATRLSIDNITQSTISSFNNETEACIKRVQNTTELTTKIQMEAKVIHDMLSSLKEKHEELECTFEKIDQLEILVNKVKDTYNSVAENLDQVEKAVTASNNASFRRGNATIIQPYFPPPKSIEIFDTNELFSSLSL